MVVRRIFAYEAQLSLIIYIGKWVCGLERATHHKNCVIYSMGVERQSSFEQEVLRQGKDCQVYGARSSSLPSIYSLFFFLISTYVLQASTSPSTNGAPSFAPTRK
jgi:hypothetical protein